MLGRLDQGREARQGTAQQTANGNFAALHSYGDFAMWQSGDPRPENDFAVGRIQAIVGCFELCELFALAMQLACRGGFTIERMQRGVAQGNFAAHVTAQRARSAQLLEDLVAGDLEQPSTKAGTRARGIGVQMTQRFAASRLHDVRRCLAVTQVWWASQSHEGSQDGQAVREQLVASGGIAVRCTPDPIIQVFTIRDRHGADASIRCCK